MTTRCALLRLLFPVSLISLTGCGTDPTDPGEASGKQGAACAPASVEPVRIEGGSFEMGQTAIYAEEGPIVTTAIETFWIDPYEVTNRQFADFVEVNGHVTLAERPIDPQQFGVPMEQIPPAMLQPGSAVFIPPERAPRDISDWWQYIPGASWRKPYGPDGPDADPNEPVVHLAWEDMIAYANWRRGRLPTEAEWEYAASAGADKYVEQPPSDRANSWQGVFPLVNEAKDGYKNVAPVGCFDANAYGLYDMVGNVWEATSDFYHPRHSEARLATRPDENSAYDEIGPKVRGRVIKGGSFLCAPNYCQRYRPEARIRCNRSAVSLASATIVTTSS